MKADAPSTIGNKKGDQGRQDLGKEDKGRQGEPRRREGGHTIQQFNKRKQEGRQEQRQAFETADTRSNKRKQEGRQGETRPPGRRTHQPTKGNKKRYNGRQRETRPLGRQRHHPTKGNKKGYSGSRHTMEQRQTRRGTMGDKTVGKGDTPSNTKADTLRKH